MAEDRWFISQLGLTVLSQSRMARRRRARGNPPLCLCRLPPLAWPCFLSRLHVISLILSLLWCCFNSWGIRNMVGGHSHFVRGMKPSCDRHLFSPLRLTLYNHWRCRACDDSMAISHHSACPWCCLIANSHHSIGWILHTHPRKEKRGEESKEVHHPLHYWLMLVVEVGWSGWLAWYA